MRLNGEEIQKICNELGVDRLNSWSRTNCVKNSLYEYYLKYILHKKEDRANSIYVVTGGMSHEILEKLYLKEIQYDDMSDLFEDSWMTAFDISELKFDRSDSGKNKRIADKYYYDLSHFFMNHEKIKEKIDIEQFVTTKIGNEYYQGYIDALISHDDETYTILDWKTSSIYVGEKRNKECGQLVMYSLALNQKGIPFDKIKIAWNFLKYVNVTVEAKNGNKKVRAIERCEIGDKLQASAKTWLKHFGYEDNMEEYLNDLAIKNDISVLPVEVQEKFEIHDCYIYADLTDELIEHWKTDIINTMNFIRDKEAKYSELMIKGEFEEADKLWWESEDDVKKQSYYFSNLCGYSANLHKPYKAYLEKLDAEKNGGLLDKKENDEYDKDDLSWLNDL